MVWNAINPIYPELDCSVRYLRNTELIIKCLNTFSWPLTVKLNFLQSNLVKAIRLVTIY